MGQGAGSRKKGEVQRRNPEREKAARAASWLAVVLLLLAGRGMEALAVQDPEAGAQREWEAVFTGESLEGSFGPGELSEAVCSLQPGEGMRICVTLQNGDASSSDWYMSNEVLESLEDESQAQGGAYAYRLSYKGSGQEEKVLYQSAAVGGERKDGKGQEGLHQASEGLEEFFYLCSLEAGGRGQVVLEVTLDGETQGNGYQNTAGSLRLNFAVEKKNQGAGGGPGGGGGKPYLLNPVKTGDEARTLLWSGGAFLGALLLLFLGAGRKTGKRGRNLRLLLCLLAGLSLGAHVPGVSEVLASGSSQAWEGEPWTGEHAYQARFYAGEQGTFLGTGEVSITRGEEGKKGPAPEVSLNGDGTVITVTGLKKGDRVSFHAALEGTMKLKDGSRYYIKGIRPGGRDNSALSAPSFTLEGENERDQDYVVAYGIRGDMTSYTIRYQDREGRELFPPEVRYGNVGDRPAAAYRYLEGYVPQAYNITKTLVKNEAENVFTFVYVRVQEGSGESGGNGGGDAEAGPGQGGMESQEGAGSELPEGSPGGTAEPFEGEEEEGPRELLALDDEEVPLAGGKEGKDFPKPGGDSQVPKSQAYLLWMSAGMALSGCAALCILLAAALKKRRDRKRKGKESRRADKGKGEER